MRYLKLNDIPKNKLGELNGLFIMLSSKSIEYDPYNIDWQLMDYIAFNEQELSAISHKDCSKQSLRAKALIENNVSYHRSDIADTSHGIDGIITKSLCLKAMRCIKALSVDYTTLKNFRINVFDILDKPTLFYIYKYVKENIFNINELSTSDKFEFLFDGLKKSKINKIKCDVNELKVNHSDNIALFYNRFTTFLYCFPSCIEKDVIANRVEQKFVNESCLYELNGFIQGIIPKCAYIPKKDRAKLHEYNELTNKITNGKNIKVNTIENIAHEYNVSIDTVEHYIKKLRMRVVDSYVCSNKYEKFHEALLTPVKRKSRLLDDEIMIPLSKIKELSAKAKKFITDNLSTIFNTICRKLSNVIYVPKIIKNYLCQKGIRNKNNDSIFVNKNMGEVIRTLESYIAENKYKSTILA